jgi:hypothetical protein
MKIRTEDSIGYWLFFTQRTSPTLSPKCCGAAVRSTASRMWSRLRLLDGFQQIVINLAEVAPGSGDRFVILPHTFVWEAEA